MDFKKWLNNSLPQMVSKLEHSIQTSYHVTSQDELGLAGRKNIYEILENLTSVLFPGCFSKERITKNDLAFYLEDVLRHTAVLFVRYVTEVYRLRCPHENCETCTCEDKAVTNMVELFEGLPVIRELLVTDITTANQSDPAATSMDEIVLSYPYVEAIMTHRIAHILYKQGIPIIPRIMSEYAHSHTGIDIHPGAVIGSHFFIDHGTGVVIGETCTIGNNVKIYQGVTLGAKSPYDKEGRPRKGQKRHPDIQDNVIIYSNSTILGGSTVIGNGAIIGGNTWITKSVPPGAKIYNDWV